MFKDVSCPIPSVCNLMKVKVMYYFLNIIYLVEKYKINNETINAYTSTFAQILFDLKNENEEFYKIWKNKIYQHLLEF